MRLYHIKFKTIAWENMEGWYCAENLDNLRQKLAERFGEVTIFECEWEA